ncbi:GNAT family N-acetyltransferase [Agrobacterium vitis]|uniref:GNAT family N-acetyltransferase n=1 Tax=Agrobacterium vitis TaxID=373 RepID=A0AAE5AWQ7_AGRVI|nr:GNAT family N-acetyltransferase [Agrobacterium vitis]MCF1500009.1 GNAT family N-acetyltransferase [Allorhizobium sp. Av2]MCM2442306.1 GNAT family N-acetyltransferase [Agrobacterium vitis]MUZ58716.1 GNAT family N-acetyltransferase [Agrobacterium vitis]MVA66351.1 GNAT family N-acetyltransferase [Agrobacterium vitis]MVA88388.1 GNAT family N-acetyltransferase [Agrobacterium vitis]
MAQMLALCAEHAEYEGLPFAETGQIERWKVALFAEPARLFAWVCDGVDGTPLAGYMTATIDYSTWLAHHFIYLDCLFLRPSHRGHGLGRALMSVLQTFAQDKGCAAIEWQTPPTNALGLGFYRAIGARELEKVRLSLPVIQSEIKE